MADREKTADPTGSAPSQRSAAIAIDPKLLEILVCPVTRQPLEYRREHKELISKSARLAFPVRDGIPIMLAEEARELADDEL
jgi:uncharacterized protein